MFFSILKLDYGKAFIEAKACKITFFRSVILGYLLLVEPKHIAHRPNKFVKLHLYRVCSSFVLEDLWSRSGERRGKRGNSPFSPHPNFGEGLQKQQNLWDECMWMLRMCRFLMRTVRCYTCMPAICGVAMMCTLSCWLICELHAQSRRSWKHLTNV